MPSDLTLSELRGLLAARHGRGLRRLICTVVAAAVVVVSAGCSVSNSSPPRSATPSGSDAGKHIGGWITATYTVAEAHRDVDQYFGSTTQLPRNVPPGLALKAIWMIIPPGGSLRQEVYDYYPNDMVPPTAPGQSPPEDAPHIQVQAGNLPGSIGNQTTPLNLGVPGYTFAAGVLSPGERAAAGSGTGGLYFIIGKSHMWTITVWPTGSPSHADLMAFLKGIPPQ